MMTPKISVIIPAYNRYELMKYAVESVLAQTLPVHEIVLIDDGSTDGTAERLPAYIAENPRWRNKVVYFRQENQGPGAARNRGIQEAKGDWLAFLDTDDFWLPQKIEWQFRALERFKRNCGLCFTDAWFTNNHCMKMTLFELAGKRHDEPMGLISDPLGYMLATNSVVGVHPVWLQGLVTRTDLARRVGFDPDLRFGDDDDFVFRLGCETQFCFVSMPMVLIDRTPPVVRHHGVSADWDNSDFRLRMAQRRYEKRLQMIDRLPKAIHNSIRQNLSAVHSGWANWFLQARNYRAARKAMTEAAKLHLTPNTAVKWALTRVSPNITRKLALVRERKRRHGAAGIA